MHFTPAQYRAITTQAGKVETMGGWQAFIGPAVEIVSKVIDKVPIGGKKAPPPPPKPAVPPWAIPAAIGGGVLLLVVAMKK